MFASHPLLIQSNAERWSPASACALNSTAVDAERANDVVSECRATQGCRPECQNAPANTDDTTCSPKSNGTKYGLASSTWRLAKTTGEAGPAAFRGALGGDRSRISYHRGQGIWLQSRFLKESIQILYQQPLLLSYSALRRASREAIRIGSSCGPAN